MNVVDLCPACRGSGEVADTEEVCPGCGGEGIQLSKISPSARVGGLRLEQLVSEFARQKLPMPEAILSDLREDERSNAGTLLREYELGG